MSDNSSPLLLFKGEAHQLTLETPDKMVDSFFSDVYAKAMSCLYDIDVDNRKYQKAEKEDGSRQLIEFNNIIAFCGERGSGKSSAMMNFRKLLREWDSITGRGADVGNRLMVQNGNHYKKIKTEAKFLCIDSVDPSRFEPSDRLIGTVVAELYRRYIEIAKEKTNKGDFDKQKKLEDAFEKALKGVQMLGLKGGNPFGTPGEAENVFEILKRVSEGASMRELFHELVVAFLNYQFGTSGDSLGGHYLVIPIDDLDMSIEHAYQLSEDIRKYLMVPNVVILVAMKLDQLRMAVEQENVERFKEYRNATKPQQRPTMDEIEAMSNLYLEKLVPIPRIVMMPSLGSIAIAKHKGLYYGSRSDGHSDEGLRSQGSIEIVVLRKVRETTALCFLPKEGAIHPIVPKTLRELHNFLEYLDDLGKIGEGSERIINIRKFQSFFLEQWVPTNLNRADEEFIGAIHSAQLAHKKRIAIVSLRKSIKRCSDSLKLVQPQKDLGKNLDRLQFIPEVVSDLHLDDNPLNITLGSLLWHIRELEEIDVEFHYSHLIFAIRTFFSFELLCGINDENEYPNLANIIGGAVFEQGFAKALTKGKYLSEIQEIDGTADQFKIGKVTIGPDSQETTLLVYLFDELKKHFDINSQTKINHFQSERFSKVFLAASSLFYFGKNAVEQKRNGQELWFAVSGNIDGGGVVAHFLFDFWAILFWNVVPRANFKRIFQNVDNTDILIESKKEIALLLTRTRFSRLFTSILQVEVLERISKETSGIISRVWVNSNMLQPIRTLWGDIIEVSDTIYKILKDDTDLLESSKTEFRKTFWGLEEGDWAIFEIVINRIQEIFIPQQLPNEGKDINLTSETIGPKSSPPQKVREMLIDFRSKFEYYRDNPKLKDWIRSTSLVFIKKLNTYLEDNEKKAIRHAEHAVWGEPSKKSLRVELANRALKAISRILDNPS